MIVQEELANNPIGYGDLHLLPLPCSGLQQADTGPLSGNFYIVQKMSFKDQVCLDKSFLDSTVFALAFFELWERTNWHPVSNTQRHGFVVLDEYHIYFIM